MDSVEYDVKKVIKWKPRELTGVPIITMPNIPRQLHGKGHQPRTLLGASTWERMRKRCYFDANYACEACGVQPPKGSLHAHELFEYNYALGEARFIKCVALCKTCHLLGVHSGRAFTLFKNGAQQMTRQRLLEGAEHTFKLVHEYNLAHPNKPPLRVYQTFLEYAKHPQLQADMNKLIQKYDMKFYVENTKRTADWGEWHLIIGNKTYPSLYKSVQDWEEAMKEASKNDILLKAKTANTVKLSEKELINESNKLKEF